MKIPIEFRLGNIIGKRVVAIKGEFLLKEDRRIKKPSISPAYILFDDGKTYIHFEEQDYYSYHDCCSLARTIVVHVDKVCWNNIMTDEVHYPNANEDV